MSKFVVRKKGFFYTDEAYEIVEDMKGSITGTYDSLEEARAAKAEADIQTMMGLAGSNAVDFFFYSEDYEERYRQLGDFCRKEYGVTINDKHYFNLPATISREQAIALLEIIGTSFHDIVEYTDGTLPNPGDFILEEDFEEF